MGKHIQTIWDLHSESMIVNPIKYAELIRQIRSYSNNLSKHIVSIKEVEFNIQLTSNENKITRFTLDFANNYTLKFGKTSYNYATLDNHYRMAKGILEKSHKIATNPQNTSFEVQKTLLIMLISESARMVRFENIFKHYPPHTRLNIENLKLKAQQYGKRCKELGKETGNTLTIAEYNWQDTEVELKETVNHT